MLLILTALTVLVSYVDFGYLWIGIFVGLLIASIKGSYSREVVEMGVEALKVLYHRGAVDADGKTGDGAGINVNIPEDFFIEQINIYFEKI